MNTTRIIVEAHPGRVEATLWINGCPVEGHGDSTGTLSTRSLVEPLLQKFDEATGWVSFSGHLTGRALYNRAKDPGGALWEELDSEGQAIWRRAEQVLSDGLVGLVERAASESNAPSSRLRRPGAGSAGQPLGANPNRSGEET